MRFKQLPLHLVLEVGRIEMDNNLTESAIGKERWSFHPRSQSGGSPRSFYIVPSAACHGINCFAQLRDVFARLPSLTDWQVNLTPGT